MLSSPIDEIKNRLDIVALVGSYIKLQKAGANWRALCPFHSEKSPSFFVSPTRQIWHCFGGCGEGGDIFKFVMRIEGVEFGDALRLLAQKAGVQLKRQDPNLKTERQRLYEICELACSFFEKQLQESKVGNSAKEYLIKRGIQEELIKKWRLGYSPDVWQGLSDFLAGKGYQREEIGKAGLSVKNKQGSFYDRFRRRIIFPIFDLNSQVIGFGGRVFASSAEALAEAERKEVAKYVNTPNTLLYDKSRVLYGLNLAKTDVRKKQSCILVEGYTDAILVSQAGFSNVAALSGTALTPYQLRILQRYTENLLTAFDMDFAGDSATKRGIDLAQSMGFNIKVLLLPKEADPAEIVGRDVNLFGKLLAEARSICEFYFETTFSKFDSKSPEGKKEISKILLPLVKRIPHSIERAFWVQELAKRLEVREEAVLEELKKSKLPEDIQVFENQKAVPKEKKSRKELLEERLLVLALKFPRYADLIEEKYRIRLTGSQDYFSYISLKADIEELQEKEVLPEIRFCQKAIQSLEIKDKLDQISQDIKKAESERNLQKVEELTKNFHQLAKKIQLG